MKFQIGDATDVELCVALQHEFLCCDDAFNDFVSSAKIMVFQGENRWIAYKAYCAYARFIHHLYEFMLGTVARDRQDTGKLKWEMAGKYISSHTQRILANRREAILNGTAPPWENHISYYPEKVPQAFAKDFRTYRNATSGHVKHERSNLSMTYFYDQYHKYLHMLYYDAKSWWGRHNDEFPDLKEITAFSILIKENPPSL